MRALILSALLLSAGLAGCLGAEEEPSGTDPTTQDPGTDALWAERALPYGDGHDHTNPAQHQDLSTPNFQVLGWDPLVTDAHGATSGDYLCGGLATEGDRDIAVTHSFGTDVAFVVVDVSDPAAPEKLGEFELENTHTYDADVTPDGKYVVLATSPLDTGPDDGPAATGAGAAPATGELTLTWRDACGNEQTQHATVPYASGVVLVDITDPTNPTFADYEPEPVIGAHSVFTTLIDGTYHVLGGNTNLAHQASTFHFYEIVETPLGPQLVETNVYSAQNPDPDSEVPLINGHVDGWVQTHPATGDTLAYLANWNGGLHVVRLDGPGQLTRLAVWNDYDPDAGAGMTGQVHEALPMDELWDGAGGACGPSASGAANESSCERHYTFIGQEVGSRPAERPTGQIIMLDTTDPANPEPVARWTLPVEVEFGASLQFSTHYIEVVDRTLFVSLYHGGLWAAEADPGAGPEMESLGVFIPDRVSPSPPPGHLGVFRWTPIVMDVFALPNGDLVTFDGTSGVYTLRFDHTVDVASPEPWTQDAWIGS